MGKLNIPGWPYTIDEDTLEVAKNGGRISRVYRGLVKITRVSAARYFSPEHLLRCAQGGVDPAPTTKAKEKTAKAPWTGQTRTVINESGHDETYHLKMLPHQPVTALRSGLEMEGITWADPLMLGIDAWQEAA